MLLYPAGLEACSAISTSHLKEPLRPFLPEKQSNSFVISNQRNTKFLKVKMTPKSWGSCQRSWCLVTEEWIHEHRSQFPAQCGSYYIPCLLPVGVNKNVFLPFKQKGFKYFLTWNHLHSRPDPNSWCSHLLRIREPLDIISKCAVTVSLIISLTWNNGPGSRSCAANCPPQRGSYGMATDSF